MSKYHNLSAHLSALGSEEWSASFADIERILGFSLPASAGRYPAWWSNQTGIGHTQSASWQAVGWRTRDVALAKRRVTFVREKQVRDGQQSSPESSSSSRGGLTIAEAKAGLSTYYAVPPENVEILIKG